MEYEKYITKKEDKELIHKDLCARLKTTQYLLHLYPEEWDGLHTQLVDEDYWKIYSTCEVLQSIPILRSMSSMTDTERAEYDKLRSNHTGTVESYCEKLVDFYIAHHLDYRGLIENGLASEALNNMYEIE